MILFVVPKWTCGLLMFCLCAFLIYFSLVPISPPSNHPPIYVAPHFSFHLPLPPPLSTVAIYLGIKKRQSPGPPDAAGMWRYGAPGTRPRWCWLCGRRRRAAAARFTRPGPSSCPAPTEPPAPALPLKLRCASCPTALPRPAGFGLNACGGHRLPFGTSPPKCPKNLNSESKGGAGERQKGTERWREH